MYENNVDNQIKKLQTLNDKQLIDIVKNYKRYKYDEKLKDHALIILKERGIDENLLKITGNLNNDKYINANELFSEYKKKSTIAFILYIIFVVGQKLIIKFLATNLSLGFLLIGIDVLLLIMYIVFLFKSFLLQNSFYSLVGKKEEAEGFILYFLIGMPFYFIYYFYTKNHMKEHMENSI